MRSQLLLTATMLPLCSLAQLLVPGMPATVYFTPYKVAGCIMSNDTASEDLPSSYAVTTGRCYNSTYEFESYAHAANFAASIPCALSIYPQVDCQGESVGVNLTSCTTCFQGPLSTSGQSFELACGP